MADTPRLVALGGPAGDRFEYRPVSGYAVAAVVCAGFYALALLVLAVAAVLAKKPILIQELLALPLAGLILSIVGRSQIKNSGGTRTGLGLCAAAWWISVIGGVAFAMYILASDLALRKQSEREAANWLAALKDDKWNVAFVKTLEPSRRSTVNPLEIEALEAEFGKPAITGFREHEIARLFHRWSATGEIAFDSLGIKSWTNSAAGYEVLNSFRIRCPEGVYGLTLALNAREGTNVRGREWFVAMPAAGGVLSPETTTDYARLMYEMTVEAGGLGASFMERLSAGETGMAKNLTAPNIVRSGAEHRSTGRVIVGGIGALALPVKATLTPAFEREFFRLPGQAALNIAQSAAFRYVWNNGAIRPAGTSRQVANSEKLPTFLFGDSELAVYLPCEIGLTGTTGGIAGARLAIVPDNPEFVTAVAALRKACWADPTKAASGNSVIGAMPPPQWRVAYLESNLEPLPAGGPSVAKP